MKYLYNIVLFLSLIALIITGACEKEIPNENTDPDVEKPGEISLFIYGGLKDVYLWYDKVDKLDNDYFADTDGFYTYLNDFGNDYEGLFYDLLYQYGTIDKWSWIVDDWEELENSFAGISKSIGYDFRLVQISNSDQVFGYIRYVIPGSPADNAGLVRGDLFTRVDGELITINNYRDLLFNNDSYSLTKASISNDQINETGTTDIMTAVVLQENPVHYSEVMDIGGVPTAYLVYNSFTSNFDLQLNDQFEDFKTQGVNRLILDLRYNGGGSIQTAIYLASMIYNTNTSEVFSISEWNDKYNEYFEYEYGPDALKYYFADVIEKTDQETQETVETPISSLGLDELYVITTSGTASASELVINGLEPYMDVIQVGDSTRGKYVGSITVKDYDAQGNIITSHKWAMQPIVLKIANSNGVSDYVNGLPADVQATEDYRNLLPFGNENEPMLKATIDYILGVKSAPAEVQLIEGTDYKVIADSREFRPLSNEMYLEELPGKRK